MATEAQQFLEKHGYNKGTYEGKLTSQGYNIADVRNQVGSWGNNMNPGEYERAIAKLGPSPIQLGMQQSHQKLQNVASQEYQFDPNQFLPGIQQQAQGVFAPQQAQLEAIRQLQSSQYQEATLQTEEQFAEQLKSEIESINARGAYFGGGAIEREGQLGDQKLRALNQLGLQAQAADFSNLAQQGILQAEESQFIQDRLYNAESGAYGRWSDQRNFSYQAALQEYQMYSSERDFARNVFESDRTYNQTTYENEQNRELLKLQYGLTEEGLEQTKKEWDLDMRIKGLSEQQAMINLKKNPAVTSGTGIFGTLNGNDVLDTMKGIAEILGVTVTNNEPIQPTVDGGIISIKKYE